MSKIVCDVCGSTYSETEVQCPVCGTAKSETAKPAVETTVEATNVGQVSRNKNRKTGAGATTRKSGKNNEEGAPSNMAMIIIVAVLLLAIVAVCIFIAVRIFDQPDNPDLGSTPGTSSSEEQPTTLLIPCTGIELVGNADNTLSFSALTETAQLTVKALPENTTDAVVYTYTSNNPTVVLVDQTGLVTPVGSGSATITITYESFSITVNVICDIPAPITELVLQYSDVTLNPAFGPVTLKLYSGELDPSRITWTSSDQSVAIVADGVVTAISNGKTTITATYGDLSASCIIRVAGMEEKPCYLSTGYQTGSGIQVYLTMGSDETFQLKLYDKDTQTVVQGVVWTFSPEGPNYCTMTEDADGIRVTAIADTSTAQGGYVYVRAEYQGEQYTCKIVVRPATTE